MESFGGAKERAGFVSFHSGHTTAESVVRAGGLALYRGGNDVQQCRYEPAEDHDCLEVVGHAHKTNRDGVGFQVLHYRLVTNARLELAGKAGDELFVHRVGRG